ncbi:MAG: hypothetical protein M0P71_16590 [Melioribacteraceae bacterium]|nr:hypothetical protein [Melioribacteraceae bacterium]
MKLFIVILIITFSFTNGCTAQNSSDNNNVNKSPQFVCSKEYLKVTKDTYNYYLKKLLNSGILDRNMEYFDETIEGLLNSDDITFFLSIGELGEEENILIKPLQHKLTETLFNTLLLDIKQKENSLDGAGYMYRVMGNHKGYFGGKYPYRFIKTITIIKDPITLRYGLIYFIDIDDKTFSLLINTQDIENDINKVIISINGVEGNEADTLENIIFLDGKSVRRSLIVNPCIDYMNNENMNDLIKVEEYCNCFADKLGEKFNSTDLNFLNETFSTESDFYTKSIEFFNLPNVKSITAECITNNLTDSKKNITISSIEQKKAGIEVFKNAIKAQEGYDEFKQLIDVDGFCECMITKLLDNFSYKEIMTDPNLGEKPKFIKIREDCMLKNQKKIY